MRLLDAIASLDAAAITSAIAAATDVNELGEGKTTPLIEAARLGLLDAVKALLARGAEPAWKDAQDETALLKAAANGHAAVVALLEPHAPGDEVDLARSFLAAFGASHAPEYQYDPSPLHQSLVEKAARAANFVGHDAGVKRLERNERAQDLKKKR